MRRKIAMLLVLAAMSMQAEYRVRLQEQGNGAKHLTVNVDGMAISFMFDTGCTTLTINKQLFAQLVQSGAIDWSDLSSRSEAELANGEYHEIRTFTIRRLTIGGYVMHDVRASIGMNDQPDAEPLFGQSFLNRCSYYTIRGNELIFEPLPESMQRALSIADRLQSDTTKVVNRQIVEALQPFHEQLRPHYRFIYAQALATIDSAQQTIAECERLIAGGELYDEEHIVRRQLLQARIQYADQLYYDESYEACVRELDKLLEQSQQEPVYERGLEYVYSSRCFVYWQQKEYEEAERATLTYANLVVAPHTWEYLKQHAIEPNNNLANMLHAFAQWYQYKDMPERAQMYERMATNAGYR